MHDKPKYLTGKDGFVDVGEEFFLHNARLDGTVKVRGEERPQAKLLVSRVPDGDREVVFTSGAGIVGQIQRMDGDDRRIMADGGMHLRLDEVPSREGNPTRVLTPANEPPASDAGFGGGSTPDTF